MTPPQYAPGQVLAGTVYRVVRHLATGGMGSVYDVEDVSVEKRYVLKTLHPQLISREDLARRMRDEAKALAKLQHPNIVDVITAGITSDAVKMPFYVMERLNGQNLRVVLEKKSALDITHSYRIAIDVADALEHAHENNIIHRDVKPENIFLHRNVNGTTTTKLLDFGIVRLLDRKASHTHGKFIGTLRYASPEQITGGQLGPATDIYSLGVVLFEMLAGRGPFDEVGDAYAIGAAHANQVPPPVSRFVRVAPEVERLVASALAKHPDQRPRDCFTFASELRRLLHAEEAAPRSATMANVLSAAAPPTHAMHASDTSAAVSSGQTMHGMIPPSGADAVSSSPPTTRLEGYRETPGDSGPVSPVAPTMAAAGAVVQQPNVQINITPTPRGIDRNAPTRESAPIGWTQRLAPNDTRIEDIREGSAPPNDDVVRAAFGEPAPLVVPSTAGVAPSSEIMFPHGHGASLTGPLAGEAQTRPPERGPYILVGVASVIAIGLVGGALALVRARHSTAAPPAVTSASVAAPSDPAPNDPPSSNSSDPAPSAAPRIVSDPPAPSAPPAATAVPPPVVSVVTTTSTAVHTAPASTHTPAPAGRAADTKGQRAEPKPSPTPSGHAPPVKFEP